MYALNRCSRGSCSIHHAELVVGPLPPRIGIVDVLLVELVVELLVLQLLAQPFGILVVQLLAQPKYVRSRTNDAQFRPSQTVR